jgi:hypothetical protein
LTDLAAHDYGVMEKDELDYDWDWDACFFGRGLLLLSEFDRSEGIIWRQSAFKFGSDSLLMQFGVCVAL